MAGDDDGGLDEESRAIKPPAARHQSSAACDGGRYGRLVTLHRGRIDQRTHQRPRLERIADPHLAVGVAQAPLQLRVPRLVDEDSTRAGAALTSRADRAEDDRRHRQVEIGVLIDDDRVVAAELEQGLAKARRHTLADLASHGRRSGEGDEVDAPVVDEARCELGAAVDEELEDSRQPVLLEDAVAELLHGDRAERGLRRGLPHAHVAADRGEE